MNRKSFSSDIVLPTFQSLESRTFLNAAPVLTDPLNDLYWMDANGARTIPINATDTDGDPISVTFTPALGAASALTFQDHAGDEFARLHFTQSDGTPIGDIVVQLFMDRPADQAAAQRFMDLATQAVKNGQSVPATASSPAFYTNVLVHRIINNFMIQTGNALNGTGTGSSGLPNLVDAGHIDQSLSFDGAGVLAMANAGANTSNCQFFITTGVADWLDGPPATYMIFGQMISGWDALATLNNEPLQPGTQQNPTPQTPVHAPILKSVQMFTSNQMDSYTVSAPSGWSGSEQVLVTLDDGHGGVTTKTITIESKSNLETPPSIGTIGNQFITPGSGGSFTIPAVDSNQTPIAYALKYGVTTTQPGVTATVDDTGLVHLAVPADFNGIFNVTVSAVEAVPGVPGGTIGDLPPATSAVTVFTLKDSQKWIDVADPTGATTVSPSAAVLSGNTLFVAAGTSGLITYDVSDPGNVTTLGSYVYQASGTAQYTLDIQLVTNGATTTAFVVCRNTNQSGAGGGLVALNVTDPANITLLDSVSSSPQNSAAPIDAVGLTIRNNVAFVAVPGNKQNKFLDGGLYVFNVADPSNITPIYPQLINRPYPTVQFYYPWDVATKDNSLYVADPAGQITVLSIGNGSILSYGTDILTKGQPVGLSVYGNFMYVADATNGLMIYDVTRAARPKLVSTLATTMGSAFSVAVKNQTAIVTTGNGYEVINVANPKKPVKVSSFQGASNGQAVFVGDQFTLPFSEQGVVLTNASDVLHLITVPDKVPVSFHDQDGHLVTVTASMCEVHITTSDVGGGVMQRIEVIPTSDKATVKFTVVGGRATAGDIVVDSNIASFLAPMVNVTGNVEFDGTVTSVSLGNMGQDSTLDLTKSGKAVTLLLDQVTDLSLTSQAPLTSLTVSSWTDTDSAVDITAPTIAKLVSKGNFQADMTLNGPGAPKNTLNSAKITGSLDNAHWDITGAMGNLTVTETVLDSTVRTTGNMGTLRMAAANGSDFLAGIDSLVPRHAQARLDFTNTLAKIAGVRITGIRGGLTTDTYLQDSNFSAASIGAVTAVNAKSDNQGTNFGFWARGNGGKEFTTIRITNQQTRTSWSWTPKKGSPGQLGDMLAVSLTTDPQLLYTKTDLGGGMFGYTFHLNGNDAQTGSFYANVTFAGVNGATIGQLQANGTDINSSTDAAAAMAANIAGYNATLDSWFYDPFASGTVTQLANSYAIDAGSGTTTFYKDVDLAYIVADGNINFQGTISRMGHNYAVNVTTT